jgi:hypothetical protein
LAGLLARFACDLLSASFSFSPATASTPTVFRFARPNQAPSRVRRRAGLRREKP